jgi:hypothetical protein
MTNERSGNEHADSGYDVEDEDEDEDGNIVPCATGAFSLIDWLSSSREGKTRVETEDEIDAKSSSAKPPPCIPHEKIMIKDNDMAAGKRMQTTLEFGDRDGIRSNPNEDHDEEDDLEDGYIAM